MKNLIIISLLILIPLQSFAQDNPKNKKEDSAMKPSKNDDGEWDLIVIDTQFDYFMNAIARPMNQYTEANLKSRNRILVNEWNSYFMSGKYRDIIESSIDYDPREQYGLKFEYKLYQVFVYVNWKYKLRMNGLSGADVVR